MGPSDDWSGSVLVTGGADEVLLRTAAGRSDATVGDECGPTTRFQAGSISKQIVAAAVVLLVERGVLDLHRPIARWLPAVEAMGVQISLHQLLSHTSGLGHWDDIPGLDITAPPSPAEILGLVAAAPLAYQPGTGWRYSGPGYLWAARVVEIVTGASYGSFVTSELIDPAGMLASTSGRFPLGERGVARGYRAGEAVEVSPAWTALPGTGDLWTTTDDLARWLSALNRCDLLGADSLGATRTSHGAGSTRGPGPGPVVATGYGYGTHLGTVLGHRAFYHPGDNPGYTSLLAWLPDLDVSVVVLSNDDGADLNRVLEQVVAPVLGRPGRVVT